MKIILTIIFVLSLSLTAFSQNVNVVNTPNVTVVNTSSVPTINDHPNRIRCTISSTAITSTLVTGCSAPAAGNSIYITNINWSSSIISTTANFMRIQSGTGGTCGTATTILYDGFVPTAFGNQTLTLLTPIKATTEHEICFVHAGAGTRLVNITGYTAP